MYNIWKFSWFNHKSNQLTVLSSECQNIWRQIKSEVKDFEQREQLLHSHTDPDIRSQRNTTTGIDKRKIQISNRLAKESMQYPTVHAGQTIPESLPPLTLLTQETHCTQSGFQIQSLELMGQTRFGKWDDTGKVKWVQSILTSTTFHCTALANSCIQANIKNWATTSF